MTFRRILVTVVALTALVALAAPLPAATFRVKASGSAGSYQWQPDLRRIAKGDRIVWKNPTSATHTVTAYKGPWNKDASVGSGERTKFRFTKKGTYLYRCTAPGHSSLNDGECSGMCGEIRVM